MVASKLSVPCEFDKLNNLIGISELLLYATCGFTHAWKVAEFVITEFKLSIFKNPVAGILNALPESFVLPLRVAVTITSLTGFPPL